jgi:hypothetical protein
MASTTTSRLGLLKPTAGTAEPVNVTTQLDNNWDAIDAHVGVELVTAGTHPGVPYAGELIVETDTKNLLYHNGSSPASAGWKYPSLPVFSTYSALGAIVGDHVGQMAVAGTALYVWNGTGWSITTGGVLDSCAVSTSGTINTGINTTETNIAKLALGPVSVVNGELYRINMRFIRTNSVSTDEFAMKIRKGTALTGTQIGEWALYRPGHSAGNLFTSDFIWAPTVTESTSIFFSIVRTSGTGNVDVYGSVNSFTQSGASISRAGLGVLHRVVA